MARKDNGKIKGIPNNYQKYILQQGYNKLPIPDHEETIAELVAEGERLLALEEKAKKPEVKVVAEAVDESERLDSVMASKSTNPYVQARAEVLKKLSPSLRKKIEDMEKSGDRDNTIYKDFCSKVSEYADKHFPA
jgi:hypothetical protein